MHRHKIHKMQQYSGGIAGGSLSHFIEWVEEHNWAGSRQVATDLKSSLFVSPIQARI